MEWYWIALLALGYLAIGGITAGLWMRRFNFDEVGYALSIIWPVFLPILVIVYIADWVRDW